MRKISRAASVCAIVLLFSSFSATVANADSAPPVSPSGARGINQYTSTMGPTFLKDQKDPSDFRSWISSLPGVDQAGYVEMVSDAAKRAGKVLWHGSSPLRAEVAAEGASRGIRVTFSERPYSKPQIYQGLTNLQGQFNKITALGFTITGVAGIRDDDGAITIEGHATPGATPDLNAVASKAANIAQVSVRIVDGVAAGNATRSNDSSPFNSGSYITMGRENCSTGFALASASATFTITARHCPQGTYTDRDNSFVSLGQEWWDSPHGQATLLESPGSGWMYDGAWNNPYGYSKGVEGFQDVGVGDWVCTSGGNSGVHCAIQIMSISYLWNDGYGLEWNIEGTQTNVNDIAVIQGDSGGPVLMPYADGRVGAVGMIQGYVNGWQYNCGAVHDLADNYCAYDVVLSSTRVIANSYGMNLVLD